MDYLKVISTFLPLIPAYIAYLTYKMNKQEIERRRERELREDSKKDVPLPPRSKRPKR